MLCRVGIGALCGFAAACCAAAPFQFTDRYPVSRIYAPPAATPADFDAGLGMAFSLTTDWSSSATVSDKRNERLVLDGESVAVTGRWLWQTAGWRFGIDVPVLYQSGGVLDSVIDDFHELFDLPEGDRPVLAQDALIYGYARNGERQLEVRGHSKGLGDVSLHVGRALLATSNRRLAWRAHIKLPTGRSQPLHGSGTTGLGGSLHGSLPRVWRGGAGEWFGGVGAQWHNGSEVLSDIHNPFAFSGYGGVQWAARSTLLLRAQIDVHSAYYDSDVRGLREAASLTLGGDLQVSRRWWLQVAIVEDIAPRTVPDVVFHLNLLQRGAKSTGD